MRRSVALVYASLWAFTAAAALVAVLMPALAVLVRSHLALELPAAPRPGGSVTVAVALFAHNGVVAGWPSAIELLGLRVRAFVALAWASLAVNGGLVGLAIGAYGTPVLRYLPQLPLEWLGLAAGAAALVAGAAGSLRGRAVLAAVALAGAAGLEAFAAPVG